MNSREEYIKYKAYFIWKNTGCTDSSHNYFMAEQISNLELKLDSLENKLNRSTIPQFRNLPFVENASGVYD
jgi:hypothetical protein